MADDDLESPITQHFLNVGKHFSKLIGQGSIQRCNCLVRQSAGGNQLPAIRRGNGAKAKFFTPEGDEIAPVISHEDMHPNDIAKMMKDHGEEYIGHLF